MATILSALRLGVVDEWSLPETEGRPPLRPLYVAGELFEWVDATDALYLENWSKRNGGRSRFEHLEAAFADFRCAQRPLVGDLNRVRPTKKGVFSLHCPGLRVFGWAPDVYSFLAVTAALSDDAHGRESIVNQKVKEVLAFAEDRGLSETIQYGDRSALFQKKT